MGLFGNLTSEGLEDTQDRLGGFQPFESDIYQVEIKVAYAGKSDGGAQNVTFIGMIGGKEYRETVYVTNKQGENFFLNKNDKTKKVPLPGFVTIDEICLVTTNKPLSDQATEEKVVKIWDPELRAESPKSVQVLNDLTGKTVFLAILRQKENKSEKDSNGVYQPIADERESNVIDKVFHDPTKMTVVEAKNGAEAPVFFDSWLERNKGQIRDRRTIKDGQAGKSTSAPQSGTDAPRKSLFGK